MFCEKLTIFHNVFGASNWDLVGSTDVDTINCYVESTKIPTSKVIIPQYNATKLEQLFYSAYSDKAVGLILKGDSCKELIVDNDKLNQARVAPQ